MSTLCDLALAFGLTLGGTCNPPAATPDPMPADDPAAWSYREPEPVKEAPAPKPAPKFPPIVIKKEVVKEVPAPAPVKEPEPKKVVVEPKGPSAVELALRAAYRNRAGSSWAEVSVPTSFAIGGQADSASPRAAVPSMHVAPLEFGALSSAGDEERYEADGVDSSLPVDNSRIIAADRYISGVLETGLNTQLDGTTGATVVIQTSRDVYGYHGRNILLPKGSRLLCAYQSPDQIGDTRAAIRCGRVLLGENRAEIYAIKANVTDAQGNLGVSGEVDTRFSERFGTAFILAGISAAVRAATATSSSLEALSDQSDALTTGGEELSENLGNIAASALEQTVNLNPILKIAQGTRIQIRPAEDWYIAEVE